jgi:hypothetical protein
MKMPSYYAIIPATIRYNKKLKPNTKLLYGEITALCSVKGFCWAKNSYFAELYKVDKQTISRWIGQLKDFGYIRTKIIYKEQSKEVKHRYIYISDTPMDKIIDTPIDKKVKDSIIKKDSITREPVINSIFYEIEANISILSSAVIQTYFNYYKNALLEGHPYLKKEMLVSIAQEIKDKSEEFELYELDYWFTIIMNYFKSFKDKNTDFNIIHFTSGDIIRNLANRLI